MADEGTTEATETVAPDEQPDVTRPEVDWKQKAREWEKRAKENAQARTELDALKASQLSNEERLAAERDQAVAERDKALTDMLRWQIATRFGIADEDVDLFLTGTDEDTLVKQAERLAERTTTTNPNGGLHVPAEGRNPSVPALNSDDLEGALKRKLGIK